MRAVEVGHEHAPGDFKPERRSGQPADQQRFLDGAEKHNARRVHSLDHHLSCDRRNPCQSTGMDK
jgi:hypothetical protein